MLRISEQQMDQLASVVREADLAELVEFARLHVLDEEDEMSDDALWARIRELVATAERWGVEQPSTVQRIVALGLVLERPSFDGNEAIDRRFEAARDRIDEAVFELYTELVEGLERALGDA